MNKGNNLKLNNRQNDAVKSVYGPVLVTAGAGSGKTSVLSQRIENILKNKLCSDYNILAITFTNKAANEMKQRVNHLINISGNRLWIMTFHSMCARMLRENNNIEKIPGYTKDFTIYDSSDKERLLKRIVKQKNIDDKDFHKTVSYHLSKMKNDNLSLDSYSSKIISLKDHDIIIDTINEYEKKLIKNNCIDFDGLLTVTYRILSENKSLLDYYQSLFKFIHVDEFQDTNIVQYDLVKLLSEKHNNIFVVGDEDQCIYTWRGANSNHIFKFLSDFPDVKTIKLEQNYRSTERIIEFANKIIINNPDRLEKKLWTENHEGSKVKHSTCYTEKDEAKYVAEQIYIAKNQNNINYSDVAVLMRLNSLTRNFEDKFLEYGIPYKVVGGMKFYDRFEIKNLLSYLSLLINPKDDVSFLRVINYPKRSIGDAAIEELKMYKNSEESFQECIYRLDEKSEIKKSVLNKFLPYKLIFEELNKYRKSYSLSKTVKKLVEIIGIIDIYKTGRDEDELRIYNIEEFIKSVKDFEKENPNPSLDEYLQSISLISDIDTYNDKENSVTLATIHGVKGLEFDTVFVVGCEENILPLRRSDTSKEDIYEERRLMYVASTRAKKTLHLTNCETRYLYGSRQLMKPSRFLVESDIIKSNQEVVKNKYQETNYVLINQKSNAESNVIRLEKFKVNQNKIISAIKLNDKVMHPRFGVGVVISLSGQEDTKTAKIVFENMGTKTLALNYAPLEIIK